MRLFAALLLLAAGCGRVAKAVTAVDDLLDEDAKVEAFRIEASPAADYSGWKESAGPVAVPASTAAAFAALLRDPASYADLAKPCLPNPGLKLRFRRSSGAADVVFCFGCAVLVAYRDGREVGRGDFDRAAPALARLFKPLFPKDAVVQGLKE